MEKNIYVYSFGDGGADGNGGMRDTLGGKGAGLAEMARTGVPVPPGYTISTAACLHFIRTHGEIPEEMIGQESKALALLEARTGKKFGSVKNPLLVSVRSGAKFSMPGMMDTILNLGLNDETVAGLEKLSGDARFAYDTYRRLLQMFGDVVLNIERRYFEVEMTNLKKAKGVSSDLGLDADDLKTLAGRFKEIIREHTGNDFPSDPLQQLQMARDAVFKSWNNDRAIYYRKQEKIPNDLGTAVNVQAMVFGNLGEDSGTGVGFTRDPSTGAKILYGEFLMNAQGEDVVAGVRNPEPLEKLRELRPDIHRQIVEISTNLEKHFRDMQDFEFTFEGDRLYLLQTRSGKRTGGAAVKVAVDMVEEGLLTKDEALLRVDPLQLDQLLFPRIDPSSPAKVVARGLGASPGAAVGVIVFDPDEAVKRAEKNERVLLVRDETSPDDIHGMDVAQGILTATGGRTSHAAVVARNMGRPCVVGCSHLDIQESKRVMIIGKQIFKEGDLLAINGTTGEVLTGEVRTIDAEIGDEFGTLLSWADKRRRLRVRTNADTPKEAAIARKFGAQGIGLCRTEHMFFDDDRLPWVIQMILSAGAAAKSKKMGSAPDLPPAKDQERYHEALSKLLPIQREDFRGIFRAMDGLPVTVRLLDPPLHEFLPRRETLLVEIALMKERKQDPVKIEEMETLLQRVEELHEWNPMMGHRGCRLGITYPEITAMQTRAVMEAACSLQSEGITVLPEIMIPLIVTANELKNQRAVVVTTAEQVIKETGTKVNYKVGTMIEVPRAALMAGNIAAEADFFSFGTNDLTQMCFGFSRDDVGKFLPEYFNQNILSQDPFVSLDVRGVGQLVRMAVERGRATRPGLKMGICGEHGGEPSSIHFCHEIGLDYVSCSPFRVPIARLAAAQVVIKEEQNTG
ncbi:MAG: pyruvate, phosphate dikinase [Candidatus Eisenbacteria bacterium]|uniref:Pyruvate, phosphate dikinase n=1 Tax=Eiseniibacteriota bacterium TaxID=2212470 RepID=A0A948RTV8_UNCEI|nr:pyruvate, phosphate dikinase [Candidatus Eisenbacteria bacterium]